MSSVKRYDCIARQDAHGAYVEREYSDFGGCVDSADYAALERECEEARRSHSHTRQGWLNEKARAEAAEAEVDRLGNEKNDALRELVKVEAQRDANIRGRIKAESRAEELERRLQHKDHALCVEKRDRESAEAERDSLTVRVAELRSDKEFLEVVTQQLGAKLSRVMKWMRGRCECCGNNVDRVSSGVHPCHTCSHREPGLRYSPLPAVDNWTPSRELEGV